MKKMKAAESRKKESLLEVDGGVIFIGHVRTKARKKGENSRGSKGQS